MYIHSYCNDSVWFYANNLHSTALMYETPLSHSKPHRIIQKLQPKEFKSAHILLPSKFVLWDPQSLHICQTQDELLVSRRENCKINLLSASYYQQWHCNSVGQYCFKSESKQNNDKRRA